jgi:hypothetical protein
VPGKDIGVIIREFVQAEINQLRTELSAEIGQLRSELRQTALMLKVLIGIAVFGLTLFTPLLRSIGRIAGEITGREQPRAHPSSCPLRPDTTANPTRRHGQ